ncbi:hypothetical protein MKW98_010549 [Papaver atlanticum]|uniref:Uncharacterized protein n=1 Tax=Papaver atlanticum TaxID=357466 RepID=A0AAD4X7X8_9MAGN|nr:hypothetical protein MKW98_010549 [Papaver atlanticum]
MLQYFTSSPSRHGKVFEELDCEIAVEGLLLDVADHIRWKSLVSHKCYQIHGNLIPRRNLTKIISCLTKRWVQAERRRLGDSDNPEVSELLKTAVWCLKERFFLFRRKDGPIEVHAHVGDTIEMTTSGFRIAWSRSSSL